MSKHNYNSPEWAEVMKKKLSNRMSKEKYWYGLLSNTKTMGFFIDDNIAVVMREDGTWILKTL